MRICVYGVGAVGGYFGGRLAEHGEEVVFLARGRTLEALRRDGLRVESGLGDIRLERPTAVERPEDAGPVDLVLVCVKAWQVAEVAPGLGPLIGPETLVLPLENGVDAAEILGAAAGAERVLDGLCRIISRAEAPARIVHEGADPYIALGRRGQAPDAAVRRIAAALDKPGITVETPDDILAAVWHKFVFIAAGSGLGAVTRKPLGFLREEPETRRLLRGLMEETVAVARARGIELPASTIDDILAFIDGLPWEATASMQRDIAAGRPSELEAQNGAIVRMGAELGVPTPINAFVVDLLRPLERRARA